MPYYIISVVSHNEELNIFEDAQFKSIYIGKKHIEDSIEATGKFSKRLAILIRYNYVFFCSFDYVKVFYDNV